MKSDQGAKKGSVYEGEYKNNSQNGKGEMTFEDGHIQEGN